MSKQNRIPAARRVIDDRLNAIAAALPILVARLRAEGVVFIRLKEVLPGTDSAVEQHIRRIEKECGAVPYAVAEFWRRIGSVDLCGKHRTWKGCEYPDPLVVFPISVAVNELEDFLNDRDRPYLIPIAPDDYHKENVSGGMWYNVDCPAVADDPPLNDERHATTFMEYLEIALKWGGYPGLDRFTGHNWPVERLTAEPFPVR